MNAAARAIKQNNFFNSSNLFKITLTKNCYYILLLLVIILANGLTIVYTTNKYRLCVSELVTLQQQAQSLQLQWGQLLLEQTSITSPARIESLALNKLNMIYPDPPKILTIKKK